MGGVSLKVLMPTSHFFADSFKSFLSICHIVPSQSQISKQLLKITKKKEWRMYGRFSSSYLQLLSNNLFWSIVVRTMIGGNLSSKSNDRSSRVATQQFSKIFVVTILFIFSSLIYPLRLLVIARFISFRS